MSAGGATFGTAGALTLGAGTSNTFTLSSTVAGGSRPFWSGWWTYTAALDGRLTLDTNATQAGSPPDADTLIFAYTGTEGFETLVGSDDDSGTDYLSLLQLDVTAGVTYHIRVGSYQASGDTITELRLAASFSVKTLAANPIYTVDGVTALAGGDRVTTAGVVTPGSVTYPTQGYSDDEPSGFSGDPHVWYKFQATHTGNLILDRSLSHATWMGDTASVRISTAHSTVGEHPTGIDQLGSLSTTTGTSKTLAVVVGEWYFVALWRFPSASPTTFILEVSDFGAVSAWIQEADQTYVVAQDAGNFKTNTTVPNGANLRSRLAASAGYAGRFGASSAFGGPAPGTTTEIKPCYWTHASRGEYSGQWWSEDPTNPDIDIHAAWHGGPASCIATDSSPTTWTTLQTAIGAVWDQATDSGFGGGHKDLEVTTSAPAYRYWLTSAMDALSPSGGLVITPPSGATLEWESGEAATLLSVDAAPDEAVHSESVLIDGATGGLNDITVRWYVKGADFNENPSGAWGPQTVARFLGGAGGPAGFASGQTVLPDFGPGASDPAWTTLPDAQVNAALATEQAWQEQWDSGVDLSDISNFAGGLRFVSLFPEVLSTSVGPGWIEAAAGTEPKYVDDRRHDQTVSLRLHVRPARYRTVAAPVMPVVEELVGSITGDQRNVRTRFYSQ